MEDILSISKEDLLTIDSLNKESWSIARSNPKKAYELAEKAKSLSEKSNYTKGRAFALGNMGAAKVWLTELDIALEFLMESHKSLTELNELKQDVQIVYMIAVLFYYLGDYDKQLKYSQEAYEIASKIDDKDGQATALNGIGTVYYVTKQPERSKKYLYQALELCEKEEIHEVLPRVLDGLGQAHFSLNEFKDALHFKMRCLEIAEAKGIIQVQSYALNGIGQVHLKQKDYTKAFDFFNKAKKLRVKMDFKAGVAESILHIGNTYYESGDFINAKTHIEEALTLAEELQAKDIIYQCHLALSDLYEKMGNLKSFAHHFRTYHKYKEDHFFEISDQKQKSAELEAKMEVIEHEKDLLDAQNKKLSSYYDNMKLLSELGRDITSTLNIDEILVTIYERVNQIMDANIFLIGLYEQKEKVLNMDFAIEKGVRLPTFALSLDDPNRVAAWVARNKKEAIINDLQEDTKKYTGKVAPPAIGEQPESIIYLPILDKNELIGLISVQSFEKKAYSNYHINMLRNLAVYAGIAIRNANVYKQVEQEVERQTAELRQQKDILEKKRDGTRLLNKIGKELISTLDIEEIFQGLHENVNKLMDAGCFGIRLYDPEQQIVHYKYEFERGKRTEEAIVPMSTENNYSVWCIQNKKAIHIGDNSVEYTRYVDEVHVVAGDFPYSLIFQPLIKGEKIYGVITVQSFEKYAFTTDHLDILETLASYTVIALENARMYETLEAKVIERTREVIEQKEIIEEKNKNITDSIKYAKRIQDATLPDTSMIDTYFEESFVLFKPKDIVSGDFYWFENIFSEEDSKKKVLFAVVDCTGHGVPGAFMSLIGTNALNQIVKEYGVTQPAKILGVLDEIVSKTLSQSTEFGQIKDGMDLAICAYDTETQILEYAGAYNPLWIIRGNEIIEYKGDKIAIGLAQDEDIEFVNHEIQLENGDEIYIFSDGFVDQFGGPKGKKLKFSLFKEIISSHTTTMKEKHQLLDGRFESWRGDFEQLDDVCILGVRV